MPRRNAKKHVPYLGVIKFLRDGDGIGLLQGWNPQMLSQEDRDTIAKGLREIARHIDVDEFENHGEYENFPVHESADTD